MLDNKGVDSMNSNDTTRPVKRANNKATDQKPGPSDPTLLPFRVVGSRRTAIEPAPGGTTFGILVDQPGLWVVQTWKPEEWEALLPYQRPDDAILCPESGLYRRHWCDTAVRPRNWRR